MKWTYRLMTASCVMFTSAQVLVSQDWALSLGIEKGWTSDAFAMEMATVTAEEQTLRLLAVPDEVERLLRPMEPVELSRNPFNSSALIPLAPIGSAGNAWYSMELSGPERWESGGRAAAETGSAGRMSQANRVSTDGNIRETAMDAVSRVIQRLDDSQSLFEQTRFGALHKKQAAKSRRTVQHARQSGVVSSARR